MSEIRYMTPNEQKAAMEREQRNYMRRCIDEERKRSSNYFLGFWGALSGALAGALLYACIRSSGWFSSLVGLFIVFMAAKCYDATKVRRSVAKLYCVAAACVLSLPVGEFLGCIISVMADKNTIGYTGSFIEYYSHNFGEFMQSSFHCLVLGYVFIAIGGFRVFQNIHKQEKKLEEYEQALAEYEDV